MPTGFASTAAAARTLRERLIPAASSAPPADGRESGGFEQWRELIARYGAERFDRRLRWDGLDESRAIELLAAQPVPVEVPHWAELLGEAADAAAAAYEGDPALDAEEPVAFEEILLPFVQVGRRRLREIAPEADRLLAPSARTALERALLEELSQAADQALYADLSVMWARNNRVGSFGIGAPGRALYTRFVRELRAARLEPLFQRYPVLARVLAVRTSFWLESTAEFVARAHADREVIAEVFGDARPGRIVEIRTGRGDTHCGGRTVAGVGYESGLQVMYKPRSLMLDQAFFGLLGWLNGQGLQPEQRILRIADRGDYGWMEFARHEPLAGEAQIADYYERAGVLVCLSYLLGAGDLHPENVIAAGAYPVLVDLEMMMSAIVYSTTQDADANTYGPAPASVLNSMLLPFWNMGPDGRQALRGGGLGMESEYARVVVHSWRDVNTDRMRRQTQQLEMTDWTNVPHLDGRPVAPGDHVEELIRGFRRCYELLLSRGAEFAAPGGPLARFRGQRMRVLLRDTRIYGAAIRGSLHPRHLHDGLARSLQLELLRTGALGREQPVTFWPAFGSEQRDLEALDYPFFWAFTDGTALFDARGESVGTYCAVPAYDQALSRLGALSEDDLERQTALAHFIYALMKGPSTIRSRKPRPEGEPAALPGRAELLGEARSVARALEGMVIPSRDGSPQWVGSYREPQQFIGTLRTLTDRLYDGRAGIALFLAALDAVDATGHTALAAAALRPLRSALRTPAARDALAGEVGIGAGLGLGGMAYALARIGEFTGDGGWIDDARLAARAITPERIAADGVLEVLGGTAGALMGLATLHELTGDRWVLERAETCAAHLLSTRRTEPTTGRRIWEIEGAGYKSGFAHGAGGIAAALLRLGRATGNEEYLAAASEAYDFEGEFAAAQRVATSCGDRGAPVGKGAFRWEYTWCNGYVGVALGRAAHGGGLDAEVLEGLDTTVDSMPDHVCCGHMGRAELLLLSGRRDQALALTAAILERAARESSYTIARDVPDARVTPAFFQGASGIGYQLLRLAEPQRVPSVLALR